MKKRSIFTRFAAKAAALTMSALMIAASCQTAFAEDEVPEISESEETETNEVIIVKKADGNDAQEIAGSDAPAAGIPEKNEDDPADEPDHVKVDGFANITVIKTDADTSEKLPGAIYKLEGSDGKTYTGTTGENGTFTFNVPCGVKYTLTETDAPKGYKKSDESITIDMSHNEDDHMVIDETGWLDSRKATFTSGGGDYEQYEFEVTQEEIDKSGRVYIDLAGRASKYPHVPIAQLGQRLVLKMMTNVTITESGLKLTITPIEGAEEVEILKDENGNSYVEKPCTVVGYLICKNQDQKPGGPFPMPYSLNYEIFMSKVYHAAEDKIFELKNSKLSDDEAGSPDENPDSGNKSDKPDPDEKGDPDNDKADPSDDGAKSPDNDGKPAGNGASSADQAVKTGDDTNLSFMYILLISSAVCAAATLIVRKKSN